MCTVVIYNIGIALVSYSTVQLEGNLIHTGGCVPRIARVAMRASAYIHREANN